MRYGIFKVKYFDSFAYIPAHEDKQKNLVRNRRI